MKALRALLQLPDPYRGLGGIYKPDLQGWNSYSFVFQRVLFEAQPRLICEVGTWKGASAANMARLAVSAELVCIDTWLGGRDSCDTSAEEAVVGAHLVVYETFLKNMVAMGLTERVTPLVMTSTAAARLLHEHGIHFDLIYIDACHAYHEVYNDIIHFWRLLSPTGIMFGDDYTPSHPGVMLAVDQCALRLGVDMTHQDGKWIFRRRPL